MPRTRRVVRGISSELRRLRRSSQNASVLRVFPSIVFVRHPDADLDLMVMPPLRFAPQVLMPVLVVMSGHRLRGDLHRIEGSRGGRYGADGDAAKHESAIVVAMIFFIWPTPGLDNALVLLSS